MRGLKLRTVLVWMLLVMAVATLLLTRVWKEHKFVSLSRALIHDERDKARLSNAVMVLETEVRALSHPSRLEMLAKTRFGLIDPGPPIVVRPEGQVLVRHESSLNSLQPIRTAGWKGGLAWLKSAW